MHNWDKDFSTAEMRRHDPFKDMVMVDGLIVPKSVLPPEIQKLLEGLLYASSSTPIVTEAEIAPIRNLRVDSFDIPKDLMHDLAVCKLVTWGDLLGLTERKMIDKSEGFLAMALLPIGLLGLFIIVIYTPSLTHMPFLCLIAPGLGFGPLMVIGTQIALTGHSTPVAWVASLIPFFLVDNLLLLNQFPDIKADKSVGRKHILIVLGPEQSSIVYILFLAATYITIIAGVLFKCFPPLALLGLATVLIAVPTALGVRRHSTDIPHLVPYLIMNVIINLTTPALLAIGLLFGM